MQNENKALEVENVFTQAAAPQNKLVYTKRWLPDVLPEGAIPAMLKAFENLPRKYLINKNDRWGDFLVRRNKIIFLVQYYLALRPREAVNLRFDDFKIVELPDKYEVTIRGENNKTKKSRKLPVPDDLLVHLKNYFAEFQRDKFWSSSPYLFPSLRDRQKPLSRYRWNEIFQAGIKECGLWRKHPRKPWRGLYTSHSIRHTRATHLLERNGFDMYAVANILGHSSTSITEAYLHCTKQVQDRLREVLNK